MGVTSERTLEGNNVAAMPLPNSDELVGLLPHRPPFRFVDSVEAFEAGS